MPPRLTNMPRSLTIQCDARQNAKDPIADRCGWSYFDFHFAAGGEQPICRQFLVPIAGNFGRR
jgi:hypothetical protein